MHEAWTVVRPESGSEPKKWGKQTERVVSLLLVYCRCLSHGVNYQDWPPN